MRGTAYSRPAADVATVYAGQGSEEHTRQQRLLALTGWSAEVLAPDQAQNGQSGTVDATTAVLRCVMCDARAGLWNFVPAMAAIGQKSSARATGMQPCICCVQQGFNLACLQSLSVLS